MWVLLNDSFVSIVQDKNRDDFLIVRARRKGDLETLFPSLKRRIRKTPQGDYMYRVSVKREMVGETIKSRVLGINYPNFKDSVKDKEYKNVLMDIWLRLLSLQSNFMHKLYFPDWTKYDNNSPEEFEDDKI